MGRQRFLIIHEPDTEAYTELHKRVKELAFNRGMSVSALVWKLLRDDLARFDLKAMDKIDKTNLKDIIHQVHCRKRLLSCGSWQYENDVKELEKLADELRKSHGH